MPNKDEFYTLPDDMTLDRLRREMERARTIDRSSNRSGVATLDPTEGPRGTAAGGVIPLAAMPAIIAANQGETEAPAFGSMSGVRRRGAVHGGVRPLVAATLSLPIWGSGQMINRQAKLGLMLFLTQALVVAAHWFLVQTWSTVVDVGSVLDISELRIAMSVAVVDFFMIFFVLWGILQAYHRAEIVSAPFPGIHVPILSGFASLVIPGYGQLVNAQPGKAVVFLFGLLTGAYVIALQLLTPLPAMVAAADPNGELAREATNLGMIALAVSGVLWILSVYDAVLVAAHRRRDG